MAGISLKWDLTNRCNLRCKHCLAGERLNVSPTSWELSDTQRKSIADKLPESEVVHINLLGGEPTLLANEFLSHINHCAEKGIKTTFNTNGLLLKQQFIEEIVQAGAAGVIISIDGPTPDSNDPVRGKGTFEKVAKNLTTLMRYIQDNKIPFETTINTVVNANNADMLGHMLDFCINMGVNCLNLLPLSYTGNSKDNMDHLYLSEQKEIEISEKFVQHICQRSDGLGNLQLECRFILPALRDYLETKYELSLPISKNCCSATTTFGYIDSYGNLYPCDRVAYEFSDVKFGESEDRKTSLLEYEFHEIWNSRFFIDMFEFITDRNIYENYLPCNRCEYLDAGFCVPCPLFSLQNKKVSYYHCLFAEKHLGGLHLSKKYQEARTNGSHYLNQHQPKRREIRLTDDRDAISHKRFKKSEGVRWNMMSGHEIIFNPYNNKFYSVNARGRKIWNMITNESTLQNICWNIKKEELDLTNDEILVQEVRTFLNALASENLITIY